MRTLSLDEKEKIEFAVSGLRTAQAIAKRYVDAAQLCETRLIQLLAECEILPDHYRDPTE